MNFVVRLDRQFSASYCNFARKNLTACFSVVVTAFCLSACFRKRNLLTSSAAVCGKWITRSLYCLSSVETPSVGFMGAVARVCNNYDDYNREIPCSISTTKLEVGFGTLSISPRAGSKSISNVDLPNVGSKSFVFFFVRVICLGQRRSLRYFFFSIWLR